MNNWNLWDVEDRASRIIDALDRAYNALDDAVELSHSIEWLTGHQFLTSGELSKLNSYKDEIWESIVSHVRYEPDLNKTIPTLGPK